MNIIRYALLSLVFCTLAACGSDPAPPARTATLKLSTSGAPSENLAGIGITVTLPDGVTPALNNDGSVAATVATVSGVAAPGTMLAPVYTPANGAAKATLRIVLAAAASAGFAAGEFATVTLVAAGGSNLALGDFTLSSFSPIDVNGAVATGLTPAVSDLALQ